MDLFDKASQVLESPDGVPIVYDLDSYFSKLEELVSKDRSFIRLPLDEPFSQMVEIMVDVLSKFQWILKRMVFLFKEMKVLKSFGSLLIDTMTVLT